VDNQVDPVAPSADEADGSAPQLDKAVRKSSATKAESEQDTPAEKQAGTKVESGPEAQPSAPSAGAGMKTDSAATTVQAETRTAQAGTNTAQAESKTAQAESKNGSSGGAGAASPASLTKVQDAKRSDATIPKAAVPQGFNAKPGSAKPESAKPEGNRPEGNGRPEMPVKPLGASAADTIAAPVQSAAAGSQANRPARPDNAAQEAESTSTLAAAALARELTGAGFASPGFASPDLSQSRPASPSGAQRPSTAETNPWVSPASTGDQPSPRPSVWTPVSSTKAQAVTGQAATAEAATAQAATAEPAAAQPATSQRATAQPATGQAATTQAPAASGTAAPPRPAYSPTGAPPNGGQAESAGVAHPAAAQAPDPYSAAAAAQAAAASVRSDSKKSKVAGPFARPGKKNKLKPSAVRRPGGAIGNGKSAVTVKSKPGTLRSPAAQAKGARSDGAEARDAQLVLSRIEPWSVMKFSFMVSLIGWLVLFVAVAVIYFAFSSLGVFHSIEQTIGLVTSSSGNPGSNAASWFSAGTVLGYTMLAGAIDVILITALATVGAVVYNAVTRLSGGVEITLQEAD
jgi:hypothetical protein